MNFHHGRDDVEPGAPERQAHKETDAPEAVIDRLLAFIGANFYRQKDARTWLRDQRELLQVLTWPAVWLNQRGVGLPADKYEARLRTVLAGVSEHGELDKIRFFPAYLGDCVRKHFIHHGEEIYEAGKHVRNSLDLAFLKGRETTAKAPDVVPALLAARAVLATARRGGKKGPQDASQGLLF